MKSVVLAAVLLVLVSGCKAKEKRPEQKHVVYEARTK